MKKVLLVSLSLGAILFSSCQKEEPVRCILPEISSSTNSPVIQTGTIVLEAPVSEDTAVTYKWTGPNGFESNLANPTISNVTSAMAGEYKVKMIKGICETPESSNIVEVIPAVVSCTPNNNTLAFTRSSLTGMTFNSVYTSTSGGSFEIRAGASNGDLTIEFASASTPLPGYYDLSNDCPTSFLSDNEVCVSIVYSGYFCRANSGKILVTNVGGKLSAVFCDVLFTNSDLPFDMTAMSKVTQP
ncbi:hypothetical protein SAMN05660845_1537 [Flavobacterium swingsii]|jgi:hypothetical protein|uniref:Ig-like domain-containing protein n=1 Tax=Flavobacterium swingsii TaxID=498292 RepID=A0A1I0Y670_9FLAO|nr:hypothetical protein [Flavobacterium swingsii]SFB08885.1 hypothetical protein SAMN05660845_1537 [Flavobacterium swingsii]